MAMSKMTEPLFLSAQTHGRYLSCAFLTKNQLSRKDLDDVLACSVLTLFYSLVALLLLWLLPPRLWLCLQFTIPPPGIGGSATKVLLMCN